MLGFDINRFPYFAIDTETTGTDWAGKDSPFSFSVSFPNGEDFYIDIRRSLEAVAEFMNQLAQFRGSVIGFNLKFDVHMLRKVGIVFHSGIKLECAQIRAALIDENLAHYDLDFLAKKYLGIGKEDIWPELAQIFGGKPTREAQIKHLPNAPFDLVARYAKGDTRTTLKLWEWQNAEIESQELGAVLKLEEELMLWVIESESVGIRVDLSRADMAIKQLTFKVNIMQKELDELAGFPVNANPSGSIVKLFAPKQDPKTGVWTAIDGTVLESTGAGKASFNAEALQRMTHPAASKILAIRKFLKARDTFVSGHVLGHQINGYVHPNINQMRNDEFGTRTRRFSYNSPAMQQIPARDKEVAAIVRPLFLPDEGHVWGCWDWKQFEFRMFAHYINNDRINQIYIENPEADFHQLVADMTGLPRNAQASGGANAKQLNLGMVFGMGGGLLAQQMKLPYVIKKMKFRGEKEEREIMMPGEEAESMMAKYHNAIPSVKQISKKAALIAETKGYVKTIAGGRLRFPSKSVCHKAAGLIYQGSSADCMKQKIVEIQRYLKETGSKSRILLSVHDETNVSLAPERMEQEIKDITHILETFDGSECPIKLRIPIRTDFGKGENWAQASGKGA